MDTVQANGGCWVIIPVKALAGAKSRLAPVLNARQRYHLALQLLQHTFRLLQPLLQEELIAGFVVVSNDKSVLALAEEYRGTGLPELEGTIPTATHLNPALAQAARWCKENRRASALLIMPSDLPLLKTEDLREILSYLKLNPTEPLAVIAPDRHEQGTNALLLRPPNLLNFNYYFGERSFGYHLSAMGHLPGVQLKICIRPGLAFDLDQPEDLAALPKPMQQSLLEL